MAAKSKWRDRKRFKALFRVYFGDEIALGPGKVELLSYISQTGSISEGARRMQMSYNRAWLLVRTMNRCFKKPLVLASRGGKQRGGAQLTKTGLEVLGLYQQLESAVTTASRPPLRKILSRLKP
jgi:molybdate transport system regulatory protein